MNIIFFLFLYIQMCFAFDIPQTCKTDLTIDKDHYNVTKTYNTGDAIPTDAHFDGKGNLFFVVFGRNFNGYYYDVKVIKRNSSEAETVPGLPERESYSIAVDKKESKVYFGTSKGIYAYNYESQEAILINKPDIQLNSLLVDKDGNKYITGRPDGFEQLYLLAGNEKIHYKGFDALDEVAVDDKNNFYYIREEKFFVLKSNLSHSVYIGNVSYEGLGQITFHQDNVFVASKTLSYIHKNDTGPMKRVSGTPEVTAIAFDRVGNFVLGTKGKLLKYEAKECYQRKN
ncbi:uncharacterized protein LOC112047799 [Bicyclus anynana]|uniref:Uncharacterized protein LOC112047799 n=1 Tax=Bicyclus anynana TaxID=110368 RepID=A0A6J1N6S7_BICAN|nr:uncharacterized protein LOC112047799 [Bicyclus anynana]